MNSKKASSEFVKLLALPLILSLTGCQQPTRQAAANETLKPAAVAPAAAPVSVAAAPAKTTAATATTPVKSGNGKRYSYTPRPYPVDDRGFSPVDKALEKAYAREDMVADDEEGSLNPYVMKVLSGFQAEGITSATYPYHCSWEPREYDIYNDVTQDMWYKGMVVAKAYPDGSRCSYCCGY